MAMIPFKVVIAGGSVVGLSLALIFERMGVDYVLFEKGEIAPQLGASIGLHPHSLKILEQLGVWEDIEKQVVPLKYRRHLDGSGKCFESSSVLGEIQANLKRPIIFIERCEALRVLHDHVQHKDRIHAHTAVVSYAQTETGVEVTVSDGSVHHGDILIGADGIHSRVRGLMAKEIGKDDPDLSQEIEGGFTSEYNTLFAVSKNDPTNPFLPDSHVENVYYDGYSGVAAAGVPGLVFWFLFVKASVTKTPHCPRFTDEDAQAVIEQYGSSRLGPTYTFKDLWDARVKATLVCLEEGVLKRWSHGRVVCIGDSVHKATVNPGLGGNLAYEGIAHFTNLLHDLLQKDPHPSTAKLSSLFLAFEEKHRPRSTLVVNLSGQITRYEAQDSWFLKFASRHIIPYVSDKIKANTYCNFSRGGPYLQFLPLPDRDQAEIDEQMKREEKQSRKTPLGFWAGVGGVIALTTAGAAAWWRGK